jgi:hypothetical protein
MVMFGPLGTHPLSALEDLLPQRAKGDTTIPFRAPYRYPGQHSQRSLGPAELGAQPVRPTLNQSVSLRALTAGQASQKNLDPDSLGRSALQPPFYSPQPAVALLKLPTTAQMQKGLDPWILAGTFVQPPNWSPQPAVAALMLPRLALRQPEPNLAINLVADVPFRPQPQPQPYPPPALPRTVQGQQGLDPDKLGRSPLVPFVPIVYRSPARPAYLVPQPTLNLLESTLSQPPARPQQIPIRPSFLYRSPPLAPNLLETTLAAAATPFAFQSWTLAPTLLLTPAIQPQGTPVTLVPPLPPVPPEPPRTGGGDSSAYDKFHEVTTRRKKPRKPPQVKNEIVAVVFDHAAAELEAQARAIATQAFFANEIALAHREQQRLAADDEDILLLTTI